MTSLDIKSKSSGFSIIELMIVLAIGGFILGMVLLAIPALQQNSRNNLRKQDVATVLGAISRYGLNNSGEFPPDGDMSFLTANYKLYYYTVGDITLDGRTNINPSDLVAVVDLDKVDIYNYAKCASNNDGSAVAKGAGYDDVVALFATESGRGNITSQCQKL